MFLLTACFSGLDSCKAPNILVSDNLKTNTSVMEVQGRQGFRFKREISYGAYKTAHLKEGILKSGAVPIPFVNYDKPEQNYCFNQLGPDSSQTIVLATSKLSDSDNLLLTMLFPKRLKNENSFGGIIIPRNHMDNKWEFVIKNPDSSDPGDIDLGMAQDKNGNQILIKAIKKLEGRNIWGQFNNFGFEFIRNNLAIGAVSVLNKGRVWIKDTLDSDTKIILASLSTSLLARLNIEAEHSGNDIINN